MVEAFSQPVYSGAVLGDVRVDGEIRTTAAAVPPSIAAQRVRAVAGHHPHVMEKQKGGLGPRQGRQGGDVEVAAMAVGPVGENNIRLPG